VPDTIVNLCKNLAKIAFNLKKNRLFFVHIVHKGKFMHYILLLHEQINLPYPIPGRISPNHQWLSFVRQKPPIYPTVTPMGHHIWHDSDPDELLKRDRPTPRACQRGRVRTTTTGSRTKWVTTLQ